MPGWLKQETVPQLSSYANLRLWLVSNCYTAVTIGVIRASSTEYDNIATYHLTSHKTVGAENEEDEVREASVARTTDERTPADNGHFVVRQCQPVDIKHTTPAGTQPLPISQPYIHFHVPTVDCRHPPVSFSLTQWLFNSFRISHAQQFDFLFKFMWLNYCLFPRGWLGWPQFSFWGHVKHLLWHWYLCRSRNE